MTTMFDDSLDLDYTVVVNDEEQYSIWPVGAEIPGGWQSVGTSGSKPACLGWIERNWTDMLPRSLRETTATASGEQLSATPAALVDGVVGI
jgi:MbtH protein